MIRRTGFTLVEILIVVIILGILAAIVIPQFTEASNDARESALASDLQTLRSQIELYKIQHLDAQPGDTDADGVADDAADFVSDMTSQTEADGTAPESGDTVFGPYLQSFPSNPFVAGTATDDVNIDGTLGDGGTGWHFNSTTGKVSPDDSGHSAL